MPINEELLDPDKLDHIRAVMLIHRDQIIDFLMDNYRLSAKAAQQMAFYLWLDLDDRANELDRDA